MVSSDIKPIEGREQAHPLEFSIGDDRFIALPHPSELDVTASSYVTVVFCEKLRDITSAWIGSIIANYIAKDDVFTHEFLETIIFIYSGSNSLNITDDAREYLKSQGVKTVVTSPLSPSNKQLTSGPYLCSSGRLYQVWKLHEDTHGAFLHTLVPDLSGELVELRTTGTTPDSRMVAVPSLIPTALNPTDEHFKPLGGWRIAVKDNFNIKGIRMSACNRAFYELSSPASKTAAAIQVLITQGATIVGTTKLASFAATEEPLECIDWPAPWNPRADGYQSPAGSSSGSGVACAAYDWIDIAIGSDTSGSGRRPGHWNGCFAMRPTHGLLSHEGFLNSFPRFDVPTFFGRELDKCSHFMGAWYGKNLADIYKGVTTPYTLIYPRDYMRVIKNEEQIRIIDSFVTDLEIFLGVSSERISFDESWDSVPPPEAGGLRLQEYMKDASRDSFFYEDYHNFGLFRQEYHDKFGKAPYISPPVRWQWELSSHITKEANSRALERLDIFRDWFNKVIMKTGIRNAIVIIPIEEISPRYRDEMSRKHFNPVGVPNLFLSPILGAPELTIPIGECPFTSKVTGNIEKLPVAVSLIASPGHDLELFDVARGCLEKAGRPTRVLTGKTLFPF
ncbi:amidase signature enzyme [Delitschia confertaspora ATCC 74209]|uniref:Amidase signature enzyme n=1 Tax=Delitschia confertaspora ATCC 74209 TaxID=1513339 RepID=A0A9P4MTS9_9PLEO|nr:amidase signature enzyme [Delitschia confertaspora ATCC 74209]